MRTVLIALLSATALGCLGPARGQEAHDFWREEPRRGGLQQSQVYAQSGQPTLKQILDPYTDKLDQCLLQASRKAVDQRIPPTDFNRIVEGDCLREASEVHRVIYLWWNSVSPRTSNEARLHSDKLVRSRKNEIVSIYTKHWYESSSSTSNAPSKKTGPTMQAGTGFFVSAAGHVLTNNHVVAGCHRVNLRAVDGSTGAGVVLGRNVKDDLALLSSPMTDKPAAKLRSPIRVGESVVAFGFPFASLLTSTGNATIGTVTASEGLRGDLRHLQISAPVQPGNSGGPLMDMRGNVVGVVNSQLDALKLAVESGDLPQNVNFAIKGSLVADFLTAHGVSASPPPSETTLTAPDVVDVAKRISVALTCQSGESTTVASRVEPDQEKRPVNNSNELETRTKKFVVEMYRILSHDADPLKFLNKTYSDSLDYYGKTLPKAEVLSQVQRFISRWPTRAYKPQEKSLQVRCHLDRQVCEAKGVLEFDARSVDRNERSFGTASFEYSFVYSAGDGAPRIIVEKGAVIERQKDSLVPQVRG